MQCPVALVLVHKNCLLINYLLNCWKLFVQVCIKLFYVCYTKFFFKEAYMKGNLLEYINILKGFQKYLTLFL